MSHKKSRALVFTLCALLLASYTVLHAMGPTRQKIYMYFHGMDTCNKLGSYRMFLTVKYDGKQVMARDFWNNSGFGGWTVSDVWSDGNIYVNMKIYDSNGSLVNQKTWDQPLAEGRNDFNLEGNPRYWAVYMDFVRNGSDVTVEFG